MASSELKLFYKIKSKEPSTTSNRRQSRTIERRNLRDDQVNRRRRHVLSRETSLAEDDEKTIEDKHPPSQVPLGVSQHKKAENLAERLKKWREEKQKKRESEKNSKKPLFKVTSNLQGSVNSDLFVKQLNTKPTSTQLNVPKTAASKESLKIKNPSVSKAEKKASVSKPVVQVAKTSSSKTMSSNKKLAPTSKPVLEKNKISRASSQTDKTSKEKPSGHYTRLTEAAKAKANPGKPKEFLRATKSHVKGSSKNVKDQDPGLHLSDSNVSTPRHSTPRRIRISSNSKGHTSGRKYRKTPAVGKRQPRQIKTPAKGSSRDISAIQCSPKRSLNGDEEQSRTQEVSTPPKLSQSLEVDGVSPGNNRSSSIIDSAQKRNYKKTGVLNDTKSMTNQTHQECTFAEENDENVDVENPQNCPKSLVTMLFDDRSEHDSPAKRPRRSVVQKQRHSIVDLNSAKGDEMDVVRQGLRSGVLIANSGKSSSTESDADQIRKCMGSISVEVSVGEEGITDATNTESEADPTSPRPVVKCRGGNRRSIRKSSCSVVGSVSDEGTASGEAYHVKKPALPDGLSHPLQELAVVKMDGEVSFIEVPLDETTSVREVPTVKKQQLPTTDKMESTQAFTPSQSVGETVHSSLDTPPKLSATEVMSTPLSMVNSPASTRILRSRGQSFGRSSTFKTPCPSVSSVKPKSGRQRRKTHCVQIKSPEEMVEVLKNSPMVEMNRRKSRFLTSPGSSSSLTSQVDVLLVEGPHVALVDQCTEKDESVKYYRDLLSSETRRLNEMCSKWSEVIQVMSTLGEEIQGQIRSTIGKAQLLINQKFKQFSGLVENCQFGLGDKETTPTDLQGFWEMIYIQVEDVNRLFADLVQLEANQWTKPATPLHKPVNKRVALKNKVKGIKPKTTSNFASFRQEILKRKTKAAIAVNDCVDMATVQDLGNVGDTF